MNGSFHRLSPSFVLIDDGLAKKSHALGLGFTWFEEPIPQTDIDGYVTLSKALDIRVSGGEQFTTLEQFRPYIERRAYSIVQPDAGCCGITEGLRIAETAARLRRYATIKPS